jgi:hypothetical protein
VPSVSGKQHRFMAAVANNPAFAKKAGIPRSVGEEFIKADKGRKFAGGGEMKESKEMMKKEVSFMKKKGGKAYASGGLAAGHKSADGIASKGKTKAKQVKMMGGGKC